LNSSINEEMNMIWLGHNEGTIVYVMCYLLNIKYILYIDRIMRENKENKFSLRIWKWQWANKTDYGEKGNDTWTVEQTKIAKDNALNVTSCQNNKYQAKT
jgi:hypothetical protein